MTEKTNNGAARLIAAKALQKMESGDGYSNLVLNAALQGAQLSRQDAAFVSALFYGVLERQLTLDYVIGRHSKMPLHKLSAPVRIVLRMGIYQLLFMERVPARAAVDESVRLIRKLRQASAASFVNAVLRGVTRDAQPIPEDDGENTACWPVIYSCPEWLVSLWCDSYGKEMTRAMLRTFLSGSEVCVRVNTTRTDIASLLGQFEQQQLSALRCAQVEDAIRLKNGGSVEKMPAFRDGLFHVQDAASQLCAAALDVHAGMTVADVCAAPGGKAFTIAERMDNKGVVHAFDLYEHRVELIREGARRLGLTCIKAEVRDALDDAAAPLKADRVLCDAPCSGFGVIGRKPEIRYKSPDSLAFLPELQYNILCVASNHVAVGGKIVYSTCTLNPRENEEVVSRFLQTHPAFEPCAHGLDDALLRPCDRGSHMATLLPPLSGTDGFFIACLMRTGKGTPDET